MMLFIALLLSATPRPQAFKPLELVRGKVVLPVLGLEVDLTPAAGGMAGARWRLTSTFDHTTERGVDRLEARIGDDVIGAADISIIAGEPCGTNALGAVQKMVTSVAGPWWHREGVTDGKPWHTLCSEATEQRPQILIERTWFDPKWKLPGEDDPVLTAVSFALRDGRYGNAALVPHLHHAGTRPTQIHIGTLARDVAAPRDGSVWQTRDERGTTVVKRVLPILPLAELTIQQAADPAACPAKLKRYQWGSLGPTLRCRPHGTGAMLIELRGPSELTSSWLDRLAK